MGHEWRKFATLTGVVTACRICGDVKRDANRDCPGVDENEFIDKCAKGSVKKAPNDYQI